MPEELDAAELAINRLDPDIDSLVGVDQRTAVKDHADVKRSADAAHACDVTVPDRSALDRQPGRALGYELRANLLRDPDGCVVEIEVDPEGVPVDQAHEPPAVHCRGLPAAPLVPQAQVGQDVDHAVWSLYRFR